MLVDVSSFIIIIGHYLLILWPIAEAPTTMYKVKK